MYPEFRLLRSTLMIGLLTVLLSSMAQASGRILVLGDSISAAYGMSLEQGWVALLAAELEQDDSGYEVVNASISGETTDDGLRRLPRLLAQYQPAVVVIELGGNDGLRGFPVGRLRANLEHMGKLARDAGAKVLILPMEIPPNYGKRYTRAFRAAFRSAAEASGAALGPFLLEGVATQPQLMQDDGIHPTVSAQPLLLDNLREAIEALL